MPELPEVETIRQDLSRHILNQQINSIEIHDRRVVRNMKASDFVSSLCGKTITAVDRRGKALVLVLEDGAGYLVIQPMMTGQVIYSAEHKITKATKISFRLSNRSYLIYNDFRMFGRVQFVKDLREMRFFRSIGPEPFGKDFSADFMRMALKARKVPIKPLLMDQTFVAGIGNIYASEILFRSRIDPRRKAALLRNAEVRNLRQATIEVLRQAVKDRGTSFNTYRDGHGKKGNYLNRLRVYGREGEPCARCASPIERIVLRGRSTFYCKKCQK